MGWRRAVVPVVVAVAAIGAGVGVALRQRHDAPAAAPVAIRSSGARLAGSLDELVDLSPLVVIGRVASVRDGRVFADRPDQAGVRSHLLEVQVGAVLAGTAPGATLVVEEEASLDDGRPIVVDGLPPLDVGAQGIWFLQSAGEGAEQTWTTISYQGRYVRRSTKAGDDRLAGSTLADPVVRSVVAGGGNRLTDAVIARARATDRPLGPLPG